LKIVIATSEGNHRETLAIFSEKSKENAYLKNELANFKQANDTILGQVIYIQVYLSKLKYLRTF
jgi:hypothetical protein